MEAREDAPRTGMELERLVDGHIGSKMLLLVHSLVSIICQDALGAPPVSILSRAR